MTTLINLTPIRDRLAPKPRPTAIDAYRLLERNERIERFLLSAAGAMIGFTFALAAWGLQ